ncbi:uncharacterized protein LOC135696594 [Rhopilema esculentum]|uniref:uncharacterized protein LOC135696594 n=1 Tax=Rhopilema esculentum TaxID=499914 RepID=UPI0031DFD147
MSGISAEAQSVLDFWFEPGKELKDNFALWFGGKSQDEIIKSKFSDLIEKARTGQLKSWEEDPKSALAHIILIDQFCRNVHRGTPKSFDCDHVSLGIAKKLVENGRYKELNPMERFFSNLPFEHSENMDDQDTALKLYKELAADTKGTKYEGLGTSGVSYSQKHREVVEKFGRFPKRNAVLGRTNTPEEEEILKNYPYNF